MRTSECGGNEWCNGIGGDVLLYKDEWVGRDVLPSLIGVPWWFSFTPSGAAFRADSFLRRNAPEIFGNGILAHITLPH